MEQLQIQNYAKQSVDALKGYRILDTLPEEIFDQITSIAATICRAPTALVSLADQERHWFKSKYGTEAQEISRDISFCDYALKDSESFFEVRDALMDVRFFDNPLVTGKPYIRFYAAAALTTPSGYRIGTLSVIDTKARALSVEQKQALRALADQVMILLESKKTEYLLKEALKIKNNLEREKSIYLGKINLERERLTKMFEQSPEPIGLMTGPNHVYTFLNTPFKKLFFPEKEALGKTVLEALPEAAEQGFLKLLDEVYETGNKYTGKETPFVVRRPDGKQELLYLDLVYDAMRSDTGETEGIVCFAVDVTEKVIARQKAEQREAFQRSLFETIPQITFHANSNGDFISFNQRWFEYIGPEQSKYKPANGLNIQVIHPEDIEMSARLWKESFQSGRPFEVKHRIRRYDGEYRWHICRAVAIKNEKNQIASWIGSSTDVQDQINTQSWLQQVLDLLPKPLFLLDYDKKIMSYSNRAAIDLLTLDFSGKPMNLIRGPVVKVTDPEGNELEEEFFPSHQVLSGKKLAGEEFILTINGIRHHVEAYSAELPLIEGTPRSALLLLNDITPLKATQEKLGTACQVAEDANRAKSQFLANMSHEIRSPLGAIIGFSNLMTTADKTDEEIIEYGRIIHRNSKHLLQIVDDILDLSKVEAGMMAIENIEFSFKQLLADITSFMKFRAEEKGIQFEIDFVGLIPEMVKSDPTRIRQILNNVIGNAIKFTKKGKVKLIVEAKGREINFFVSDTGIGISEESVSKLFVPFQQADNSTTRNFGGTGLGLALSRKFSEALGGSFDIISSQVGVGSIFKSSIQVQIPEVVKYITLDDLKQNEASQITIDRNLNLLRGIKILLVEDSLDNQILIEMILNTYGAQVVIANDGLEGLGKALSEPYDIILCDLQMPRMDGYEMIRRLKEKEFKSPVIALTAHAMKEDSDRALESGFTDYLTKPISTNDLIKVIKEQAKKPYVGSL